MSQRDYNYPFHRTRLAGDDLRAAACRLIDWASGSAYEVAVYLPLARAADQSIRSAEWDAYKRAEGFFTDIPLAVLSGFPQGHCLLAIFDTCSEDDYLTKILRDLGIRVLVIEKWTDLSLERVSAVIGRIEASGGNTKSHKPIVGQQQRQAYSLMSEGTAFRYKKDVVLLQETRFWRVAVFEPNEAHKYPPPDDKLWNHARASSFDIVAVDRKAFYPLLAVEYDGTGHSLSPNASENDKKEEQFCEKIGLPLIRLDVSAIYSLPKDPLKREAASMIKKFLFDLTAFLLAYEDMWERWTKKACARRDFKSGKGNACDPFSTEDGMYSIHDDLFALLYEYEYEAHFGDIEFRREFGKPPQLDYYTDHQRRIGARLAIPATGNRAGRVVQSQGTINVRLYGFEGTLDVEPFIKSFLHRYLLGRLYPDAY